MHLLMRKPGSVVRMDAIIMSMYPRENEPEDAYMVLRQVVSRLRAKLGKAAIENVRGSGYRITDIK